MGYFTEVLKKAQDDLEFLRGNLREANKLASEKNPIASMVIMELIAMQTSLETKLNQLVNLVQEDKR